MIAGSRRRPAPPTWIRDRAAEAAGPPRAAPAARAPVIDTRRYQRMIGLVGLTLVVVISVAFLSSHRAGHGRDPGRAAAAFLRRAAGQLQPQRRRQPQSARARWPSTTRGRSTSA